jgi:Carboxypeptidase regulatory-like domain/TonB dependent receptor-like, beta-barrel
MQTNVMKTGRLAFLLLFAGIAAFAQSDTGGVSGVVVDESGGVLQHVEIVAENQQTGARRTVHSSDVGRYHILQLAPGPYRIAARLEGFETGIREGVVVTVGREAGLNLTLKVGAITQETVVVADAAQVETISGALSALMDNRSIRELPLNGRDLAQLALLEPGVTPSRRSSDSGGPGAKLVVSGNRPSQVSFVLDGSDINDANNNTPGSAAGVLLGVDTLQEFRVLTNSYNAAFGRSAGGVISAATRSGTNAWHGSLFEFVRNSSFDAKNFFDAPNQPIPPFKRNQFGAIFEGPIHRDKTFFLISYEGLRQRLGLTSRTVVPDQDARLGIIPGRERVQIDPSVPGYLDLIPLPNGRNFGDGTGELILASSQATNENFVTGRIDHRFSGNTSLFGRFAVDSGFVRSPDALALSRADSNSRNQYFTTQLTHLFSERLLNDFRVSYNRSHSDSSNFFLRPVDESLSFFPGAPLGQISVTGLFSLGPSRFGPSFSTLNLYQFSDNIAYTGGIHSIKAGVDYRFVRLPTSRPQSPYGYYQFPSLTNFLQARPQAVELTLPDSVLERNWRQSMTAFYLQDDLRISRRLVLNLGLRYERVSTPRERDSLTANLRDPRNDAAPTVGDPLFKNPSNKNFAPRAGIAWDPFGDGKTSVRSGFGLFFDPIWTDFYANAANRNPPFYTLGSIRNPVFPNAAGLIGNPNFVLGRLDALTFEPRNPYTMQYNFSLQRELSENTVLSLNYVGQRGVHLVRLVDANQALPTILEDGRKFFPAGSVERNPNFTGIRYKVTDAQSFYNALQVSLDRRLSRGLQLRANYTYSKSVDDGSITITQGGDNDMTQDPDDRRAERGLSNYDLRHYFVTFLTYDVPDFSGPAWLTRGWQFNTISTLASGNPFSVLVGFDRARAKFQAGTSPQRPDLAAGASNNPILGGPDRYFDPSAFVLPEAGFFGTLGRNTLIGPGLFTIDLSVSKRFQPVEGMTVQFRAEVFNALNRPNFSIPSQRTVFSSSGPVGSAGRISSTQTSARQLQLGLKVIF